jgi:hypothetical protein
MLEDREVKVDQVGERTPEMRIAPGGGWRGGRSESRPSPSGGFAGLDTVRSPRLSDEGAIIRRKPVWLSSLAVGGGGLVLWWSHSLEKKGLLVSSFSKREYERRSG